jgi:hypothetical protein
MLAEDIADVAVSRSREHETHYTLDEVEADMRARQAQMMPHRILLAASVRKKLTGCRRRRLAEYIRKSGNGGESPPGR